MDGFEARTIRGLQLNGGFHAAQKAIVTGGSTGIGRGIVQSLAQAGYDVVFSYRNNEESAQNVLDELCKGYPEGTFKMVAADFGDKDATKPFFKKQSNFWEAWIFW